MVSYDMTKTPVVNVVDDILAYAATHGASDIHFDPRDDFLMVRMRVDGDLNDYTKIQKIYERNLITRIKLLANMNITESRLPQDGSIKGTIKGIAMETRVSTLPTNEGEKCVIRILDYSRSLAGIDSLGFNERNLKKLKKMIKEPNGIILITGATGSGKSTTVYSILQVLNNKETNIITVEDPIEMNIEGLNQVQVNSEIGLDFATVLRSILRQDPNVILVGEIRDSETAKIAVRASITGHLVLSTVHTNNSLSTIERLLDMNVERYLLSSALTGIISQRLAKMLCPHCRKLEKTTPYQKKVFKLALHQDIEETYVANHDGCEYCSGGYHDRVAIQEVLLINDEIRNALNEEEMKKEDLQKIVYTSDVITMLQDGLYKVLDGTTSFEEIYKIIDIDDDLDTLRELGLLNEDMEVPSANIVIKEDTSLPKIDTSNIKINDN
ncbi:type II/IV secretion system protein [bacterium]|nr:type II/IV secretion system protein [bacterium]